MSPALIILILLGMVTGWFLLSFLFVPIGKVVCKVFGDAKDIMNEENNEKEN